jgi:hypothetical protein
LDVTLGREFLVGLICAGEFGDFRQIVTLDSVTLDRVDCSNISTVPTFELLSPILPSQCLPFQPMALSDFNLRGQKSADAILHMDEAPRRL